MKSRSLPSILSLVCCAAPLVCGAAGQVDPDPGTEPDPAAMDAVTPPAGDVQEPPAEPPVAEFVILERQVAPGELRQFNWQLETAMVGLAVPTPVLVAHGSNPGPTLCLVAAVHGDELNGVEIVRRIVFELDAGDMAGTVVGLPIANTFGFLRSSRYLPDRRDLNRYFPGAAGGSMASRFAHSLFHEVISHCNVLVDIHTGSFYRTNLPQLRADLRIGPVLHLTKQFGDIAVLHSVGPTGSLRRAASDIGIAAVTLEAGGPARFQEGPVEAGVKAIEALLNHLGMVERFRPFGKPQPVFYESTWVRAETGGILLSQVKLGDMVQKDQRLATVTDPIENRREYLNAPFRGRILGMAVNQVVMPGFAAFHIGRAATERDAIQSSMGGSDPADFDHAEEADGAFEDDEGFGEPGPPVVHPDTQDTVPASGERERRPAAMYPAARLPMPDLRWVGDDEPVGHAACPRPPLAECRQDTETGQQ